MLNIATIIANLGLSRLQINNQSSKANTFEKLQQALNSKKIVLNLEKYKRKESKTSINIKKKLHNDTSKNRFYATSTKSHSKYSVKEKKSCKKSVLVKKQAKIELKTFKKQAKVPKKKTQFDILCEMIDEIYKSQRAQEVKASFVHGF